MNRTVGRLVATEIQDIVGRIVGSLVRVEQEAHWQSGNRTDEDCLLH
jgi:hypothetical protein